VVIAKIQQALAQILECSVGLFLKFAFVHDESRLLLGVAARNSRGAARSG
jgi:hypothetical protein